MKIFVAILLLLLLFLCLPVRFKFNAGEAVFAELNYLGVKKRLWPKPPEKEGGKKSAAQKPKKKKPQKPQKPKIMQEQSLAELLELARLLLQGVKRPVQKLLKRTSLARLSVAIAVGGQDAHRVAVRFGQVNAAVYNSLCALDKIFTIRVKKIAVFPDFCGEGFKYDCEGELRIVPLAVLIAVFSLLPLAVRLICKLLLAGKKDKKAETGGEAAGQKAA